MDVSFKFLAVLKKKPNKKTKAQLRCNEGLTSEFQKITTMVLYRVIHLSTLIFAVLLNNSHKTLGTFIGKVLIHADDLVILATDPRT